MIPPRVRYESDGPFGVAFNCIPHALSPRTGSVGQRSTHAVDSGLREETHRRTVGAGRTRPGLVTHVARTLHAKAMDKRGAGVAGANIHGAAEHRAARQRPGGASDGRQATTLQHDDAAAARPRVGWRSPAAVSPTPDPLATGGDAWGEFAAALFRSTSKLAACRSSPFRARRVCVGRMCPLPRWARDGVWAARLQCTRVGGSRAPLRLISHAVDARTACCRPARGIARWGREPWREALTARGGSRAGSWG